MQIKLPLFMISVANFWFSGLLHDWRFDRTLELSLVSSFHRGRTRPIPLKLTNNSWRILIYRTESSDGQLIADQQSLLRSTKQLAYLEMWWVLTESVDRKISSFGFCKNIINTLIMCSCSIWRLNVWIFVLLGCLCQFSQVTPRDLK